MAFKFISGKKLDEAVSQQAMQVCERIISEMGAELHDDLIQKLSILRLHLDKIERSNYDVDETRDAVIKMQSDFQDIVDAVKRISRRLHPVKQEDDDFRVQIEMLCQNMDFPGTVRILPSFHGDLPSLHRMTENYLLRMIQELIHNSFRHSAAWNVWVRVSTSPKQLTIEVEDDGSGFSRLNEFIGKLRNKHNTLRMRAESIGAKVRYESSGKGLLATITLPLE